MTLHSHGVTFFNPSSLESASPRCERSIGLVVALTFHASLQYDQGQNK